jgi:hypothetical protein
VGPVANCRAEPQTAENEPVVVDGRQSFHLDPSHKIVLYEWDCDNDGTFEKGGPDMDVSECTYGTLGEHFACLRVTDDSVPPLTSQMACCKINVVPCPRPPNSHPGGPYCFCIGVHPSFLLDGSLSSISPCRSEGRIASYSWDFKQPLDRSFDDAVGPRVNVTEYFAGLGPGTYSVELRVVDDLENEDIDATTITVSSRADCGKPCPVPKGYQIPGDANQDGTLDISDAIWLLELLFVGAERVLPCEGKTYKTPGAGDLALLDWNGDGALSDSLDISDPICLLTWLFLGACKEHPLGRECTLILGCPDRCNQ